MTESITHRVGLLEYSLWERTSTLRHALSYMPECYLFGLGYAGTHHELTQHLGNTVHVFHIGLPLIGGLVCAFFHYVGVVILLRMLFRLKHEPLTVLMLGQLLALCTMPVLMHSFQYISYMLVGAVVVSSQAVRVAQPVGQPLLGQSLYPARPVCLRAGARA